MGNGEHRTIDYAFYSQLGAVLSKLRHNRGISLSQVAKCLKTSKTTVDDWELGKRRISVTNFNKLCLLYGVSNVLDIAIKTSEKYDEK